MGGGSEVFCGVKGDENHFYGYQVKPCKKKTNQLNKKYNKPVDSDK